MGLGIIFFIERIWFVIIAVQKVKNKYEVLAKNEQ